MAAQKGTGQGMARTGKLSAVEVAKAKGPSVLHDGGGLYLRVSPAGKKAWVFRFQIDGKRRDMGLGPFPDISLSEARERATVHRKRSQDGKDPLAHRKAEELADRVSAAKGRTFREVAADYIAKNKSGWRSPKSLLQWENTLAAYAFPIFGDLPASAIDTGLVVQALEPIWKIKPETANRVRGRIEAILDSATVQGFRAGPNPAQWRGTLAHILPAPSKVKRRQHLAALPFDEVPGFMAELRGKAATSALALQFAILTAARTGEALGATWGELDLDAKIWSIPADRMKAERDHRVPLSQAALDILSSALPLALQRDGMAVPAAPVFPGHRRALALSNMAMLMLLRRMKRTDITAHGFRSSFRDWASERTAFPRDVVEMALAHAVENKTEAAYRRGDLFEKRRLLMAAWATFCCTAPAAANVVQINAQAG